jgi:hypothetical protein
MAMFRAASCLSAWATLAGLLAALTGCEDDRPTPPPPRRTLSAADRETLLAAMSPIQAKADAADKERHAAFERIKDAPEDPAAAKCAVTVATLLGDFEKSDLVTHRTGINTRASKLTELYPPPAWWHDKGHVRSEVDSACSSAEMSLRPDADLWRPVDELLAEVRAAKIPDYVLTVAATEAIKPISLSTDKFQGGLLRGRAFLWSERDKRYICSAAVAARNSSDVKVFSGGDAGLFIDLIASAAIQATANLTVLPEAPPTPASASAGKPGAKAPPKASAR